MNLKSLEQLLSPTGQEALTAAGELAPTEARYPACYDRLRKHWPENIARAALDTVLLRQRARTKFTHADRMYFDREALTMASGEAVSAYRAARFAPFSTVADLCCGIGSDAIGLAQAGCDVTAIDRDPLRVRMAAANLAAFGLPGQFRCADVLTDPLPDCAAVFVDPGRRPGGRRTLAIADYEPPVAAVCQRLQTRHPTPRRIGFKTAPGIPWDDVQSWPGEVEFLSSAGELKECILWQEPERETPLVRATLLPGPFHLSADSAEIETVEEEITAPGRYLYDPDPAISRAGLLPVLAAQIGATRIEPGSGGFCTADQRIDTPFAAGYRVDDVLPFHIKRVGDWLAHRHVGRITIVKRSSSADAEALMKRWKLRGDRHQTVILTRAQGEAVAILATRL
ncbi:MAG: methyltransferase domain-containing protein [Bacteroidales bacterium]|nr:methyltransferase domain-containing protein [Bacteroidales bacterium]